MVNCHITCHNGDVNSTHIFVNTYLSVLIPMPEVARMTLCHVMLDYTASIWGTQ